MKTQPHDSELERLQDERVHLRIKLNLAQENSIRDAKGIERLQRSLEKVELSIAARLRGVKIGEPGVERDRCD